MRLRYEGEYDSAGVSLSAILELPDREAEVLALVLRRADASAAQVAALVDVEPARRGRDPGLARRARARQREPARRGAALRRARRAAARRAAAGRRLGGAQGSRTGTTARPDGAAGRSAAAARRHRAGPAAPRRRARRGPACGRSPRVAGAARSRRGRARLLAGDRARFLAGVCPVAAVFAFAAWQSTTNAISLADVLSFLGVIIVALLAGVFPVLLLVAARNRGELLPSGYRLPAARWVLGVVYVVALGGVALHGLVLWEDPLQRACALAVTALALAMTVEHGAPRHVRAARDDRAAPRRRRRRRDVLRRLRRTARDRGRRARVRPAATSFACARRPARSRASPRCAASRSRRTGPARAPSPPSSRSGRIA